MQHDDELEEKLSEVLNKAAKSRDAAQDVIKAINELKYWITKQELKRLKGE